MKYALPTLVAIYIFAWFPFGLIVFLTHEWPRSWVAWWAWLGNPMLLALIAGLSVRAYNKRYNR